MIRFASCLQLAATLAACSLASACAPGVSTSAQGPQTPGWTGRTVVIGNTSTIAGDADATYLQQKWPYGNLR